MADTPRRRLSYTNRARLQLLASPLLMLILFVLTLAQAVQRGTSEFAKDWWQATQVDWRWLHRDVYRVARYGSVWDDVDDSGRPKAWARKA